LYFSDHSFKKQAWQESNLQRTVLETVALPIGATGLYAIEVTPTTGGRLFLCFFMNNAFTAMRTKFLQLQTLWFLFFVLSAVVIDTAALSALKMNCLAHVPYSGFLALPRYIRTGSQKIFEDRITSPRAGLNRWPRPYQGRALPTELQGQVCPLQKDETKVYLHLHTLSREIHIINIKLYW
jgi:hypothetical protein